MRKSKLISSILNALVTVISTFITSLLGLISTKLVLQYYGSDLNGIVATGNQLINILLIIEGGVTLAINVSLFEPYVNKIYDKLNSIMMAAKKTYSKIGITLLSIGIVISIIYTFFIKSSIDSITIILIFSLTILSSAFNIGYVIKYRIMYQVSQTEYRINTLNIFVNLISSIVYIILLYSRANIILVRASLCFFSILNGFIISLLFKKDFKFIQFKGKPDYSALTGTKDIIIQKFLNILYTTTPTMYISSFLSTVQTSIYSVYYSIFNIIRVFLQSIVSSPINGFGQLLVEDKQRAKHKYIIYEFLILIITTCLVGSLIIVIVPFIKLYTAGISDANYINFYIAILMGIILFLEIIHLPAGNIINITGNFTIAKNIQMISCVILVISMLIFGLYFNMNGVLISLLITNVVLCILEIGFVHVQILNINLLNSIKCFVTNFLIIILSIIVGIKLDITFNNYVYFVIIGFLVFITISILTIIINYIFNKKELNGIFKILISMKWRKNHE